MLLFLKIIKIKINLANIFVIGKRFVAAWHSRDKAGVVAFKYRADQQSWPVFKRINYYQKKKKKMPTLPTRHSKSHQSHH